MPFVALAVGLAIVSSYVRGGRLSRLADAPLRWSSVLALGVTIQVGVDVVVGRGLLPETGIIAYLLLLASQLLVVVWVVANWHLPGTLLIALGLLLNAVVMAVNGAMPVDLAAIHGLGYPEATIAPGKHTVLDASTRLPWLADIFPLPPLRTIVSVGDIVLTAGLIPLVHALMAPSRRDSRRRAGTGTGTEVDPADSLSAPPSPGRGRA